MSGAAGGRRRGDGGGATWATPAWLALVVASMGCGGGEASNGVAGAATGRALVGAIAASAEERAPWRCGPPPAAEPGPGIGVAIGDARWTRRGGQLRLERGHGRIGLLVDARADVVALTELARALRAAEVDAVVSLGGLGATRAELVAAVDALAGIGLLVLVPGDLEAVADLRAVAVAAADRGVVDGLTVRWLEVGELGLALLPGQPDAGRLAAGVDGCGHTDADAAALMAAWPDGHRLGARVLASQRALRADQADLGQGDLGLRQALDAAELRLTIGGVDGAGPPPPRAGRVERGARGHAALPPASDDAWRGPAPRPPPQAMIVEAAGGGAVAWRLLGPAPAAGDGDE